MLVALEDMSFQSALTRGPCNPLIIVISRVA